MRHNTETKTLGRSSSYRRATIRSIVKAVLKYQRIKTTKTRARLAQQKLEHLISLGKEGSLHSKRLAYKFLGEHLLVKHLFDGITALFKDKTSGFSRIIYLNQRRGDNSQMVILELTEKEKKEKHKKQKELKKTKEKPTKEETKPQEQVKPVPKEKPTKKFLGGLRTFFKKERDSL